MAAREELLGEVADVLGNPARDTDSRTVRPARSSPRPPLPRPAWMGWADWLCAVTITFGFGANHVPHPLENRPLLGVSGDMVLQAPGHPMGYFAARSRSQVPCPLDHQRSPDHAVEAPVRPPTDVRRHNRRAGPNGQQRRPDRQPRFAPEELAGRRRCPRGRGRPPGTQARCGAASRPGSMARRGPSA